MQGLTHHPGFFDVGRCDAIEEQVEETVRQGQSGLLDGCNTVDNTLKRAKYFFGHGYTYGQGKRGREELLPAGTVSAIPTWIYDLVIKPLEDRGLVAPGWIDSVVMNDYYRGGGIVAHIDPPQLFARPIISASFFAPAHLVFNSISASDLKEPSTDGVRHDPPLYTQLLSRGSVLFMDRYAANEVTHGIRPEDLLGMRRVSLILRHVLQPNTTTAFQRACHLPAPSSPADRLIAQLLGSWRDPPGRSGGVWFYIVSGCNVEVLDAGANKVAMWQLQPCASGVLCGGLLLEPHGASHNALRWKLAPEADGQALDDARADRLVWLRLEVGHGLQTPCSRSASLVA